jgi:hypothetical protein
VASDRYCASVVAPRRSCRASWERTRSGAISPPGWTARRPARQRGGRGGADAGAGEKERRSKRGLPLRPLCRGLPLSARLNGPSPPASWTASATHAARPARAGTRRARTSARRTAPFASRWAPTEETRHGRGPPPPGAPRHSSAPSGPRMVAPPRPTSSRAVDEPWWV